MSQFRAKVTSGTTSTTLPVAPAPTLSGGCHVVDPTVRELPSNQRGVDEPTRASAPVSHRVSFTVCVGGKSYLVEVDEAATTEALAQTIEKTVGAEEGKALSLSVSVASAKMSSILTFATAKDVLNAKSDGRIVGVFKKIHSVAVIPPTSGVTESACGKSSDAAVSEAVEHTAKCKNETISGDDISGPAKLPTVVHKKVEPELAPPRLASLKPIVPPAVHSATPPAATPSTTSHKPAEVQEQRLQEEKAKRELEENLTIEEVSRRKQEQLILLREAGTSPIARIVVPKQVTINLGERKNGVAVPSVIECDVETLTVSDLRNKIMQRTGWTPDAVNLMQLKYGTRGLVQGTLASNGVPNNAEIEKVQVTDGGTVATN